MLVFRVIILHLNLNKKVRAPGAEGTTNVQTMVALKYLNNFCRTLEMSLIKCEINFILTWYKICIISNAAANQDTTFTINDTKVFVPVLPLSTQDNVKPLQPLKLGFKRTNITYQLQ